MKRIMHIDIDAFFASAEISRNKELENKPVGVAVKLSGILSAANYIARKYGVKAAMHINKAKELCPELICIKADMNFYRELSNNFFSFLDFYLKKNIEIASVDECYVDITDILEQFNNNENLFVANLKYQIKKEFGLNVSIGISKNKYTAKLLSDNSKPNGFLSDNKVEVQDFKIDNMLYIGTDKIKKLNDNDIFTIRDFFDPINEHK
ncbi:MAG: DNA polymerase IV, partial [Ureaplasma sp.]|nr:DNA polymerase IV [Ureaplasma sp.]